MRQITRKSVLQVSMDSGSNAGIERVNHAILAMYGAMGIDPALGTKLPQILSTLGCPKLEVFTDLPQAPGGSPIADMMGMSINHWRARLVETGIATNEDVDRYVDASRDTNLWATYYTTVSVWGRKGMR